MYCRNLYADFVCVLKTDFCWACNNTLAEDESFYLCAEGGWVLVNLAVLLGPLEPTLVVSNTVGVPPAPQSPGERSRCTSTQSSACTCTCINTEENMQLAHTQLSFLFSFFHFPILVAQPTSLTSLNPSLLKSCLLPNKPPTPNYFSPIGPSFAISISRFGISDTITSLL